MREIPKAEAMGLIQSCQAGWWSLYANPPIPHATQHVVEVGERYFLLEGDEITIEPTNAIIEINGIPKQTHIVKLNCDAILPLVVEESAKARKLGEAGDVPVIHTQNLEPKDQ